MYASMYYTCNLLFMFYTCHDNVFTIMIRHRLSVKSAHTTQKLILSRKSLLSSFDFSSVVILLLFRTIISYFVKCLAIYLAFVPSRAFQRLLAKYEENKGNHLTKKRNNYLQF